MAPRVDEQELRRRAVAGVRHEVEAFGSAAPDSFLIQRDGLLAAVVPASPERSIFNSVFYADPAALAAAADALAEAYASSGVRAWTVWVPDADRAAAELLAARGHAFDGAPRAMALDLADLAPEPPAPQGIEPGPIGARECAALNDRAYGYDDTGFRAGFYGETAIRWHGAFDGGEAVACLGMIDAGDGDWCVSGVATPPEHRGRGIATWLLWRALREARQAGGATASLRASHAGAPLYERLGFRDLGFIEMWELRR
jgi:GNAT superfamily N-acetyltransferase